MKATMAAAIANSPAVGIITFLTVAIGLTCADIRTTLSYSLLEEIPVGTLMGNVAVDSGLDTEYGAEVFKELQLTIVDQGLGYENLFRISGQADLETATRLDREALCPSELNCELNLKIQVNPSQYFHFIQISIQIIDANDNAPYFKENPITWRVSEGPLGVGEYMTLDTAIDNDSPKFGVQRYSLNDTSGNFELRVQNSSGAVDIYLYLVKQLDRESKDVYSAQVIAYDGGSPPKQGILYVNIEVQDINDNKPVFTEESYSVSVSESLSTGSTILRVSATDNDIGANGRVVYSLADKTYEAFGHLFAINDTSGEISIIETLDHESEKSFGLTVVAKNADPGTNSMSSFTKVQVNVLDANDNPPKIKLLGTNTNTVELSEAAEIGEFVAVVNVEDPDAGNNGKFSCALNNNFFQLQQILDNDFKIITAVKLDREVKSRYELRLECRDQGEQSRSAEMVMYVDIKDENDNPPQFLQPSYGSSILENNNRGTFIVRIQATDKDAGKNGQIRYSFMDAAMGEMLLLDPITGNITARISFDHETNQRLEFKVVAADLGDDPHTGTVSVVLDIMDVDDEKPQFSKDEYEMFIYEGLPLKSQVGQVSAEDRDSEPFNKFKFSLNYDQPDANSFTIEPETGKIYTSEVLDRETKSTYRFIVEATSLGLHPVTSTASVSVFVADKNDGDPIISFPTMYNNTVYMSNRAALGEVVTRVRAHDPDSGGDNSRLSFSFISGNEDRCFAIDELTGAVTVEKDLGYISHQLFGLVVSVRDHGSPPRTSEAFLNIIVNRSIGHSDASAMSNQNLTIVIAIASVSGFLMVILVVAIVILLRWPWLASRKYNYVARLALRKNSTDKDGKLNPEEQNQQVKQSNLRPDLDYPEQNHKYPAYNNVNYKDETDGRCKQIQPNRNSTHGIPLGHDSFSQRQQGRGSQRSQRGKPSKHHTQHPPIQTVSGTVAKPGSDKDTDSACSADMSNATDSGRGSTGHEELENEMFHNKPSERLNIPRNGWNGSAGHPSPGSMPINRLSPGAVPDRSVRFASNPGRSSGRRRPPPPPPGDYSPHGATNSSVCPVHNVPNGQAGGSNIYLPMSGHHDFNRSIGDGSPAPKNISSEIHV